MGCRRLTAILAIAIAMAFLGSASAEQGKSPEGPAKPPEGAPPPGAAPKEPEEAKKQPEKEPAEPVVTQHEIRIGERTLRYEATAGFLPIRNAAGETEADMFFIAYAAEGEAPAGRPLMFAFNGGPGSSSVWLHLGALGPRRVKVLPDGGMPPPPFRLEDNAETFLDRTDLVFVDPVGTGYSRAAKPDLAQKFYGIHGDIESVAAFIRLYLTRYERWSSPLFVIGESYGTTRAAGLAGRLVDEGIALNGVLLISMVLNFQTIEFNRVNDLPHILYLPTFAAAAWYHKKLEPDLEQSLQGTLREVEAWAGTRYAEALLKGDRLGAEERKEVVGRLARYTGLPKSYVDESDLRVDIGHFTAELLRDRGRTIGRMDARFEGLNRVGVSEVPDYDPSLAAVRPPFTQVFNEYVRKDLGYETDRPYHVLGGEVRGWDWGSAGGGFPETAEALRGAMTRNPYLRLFVAEGLYDLATPYFAAEYTLAHLRLDPGLRKNITTARYEAGHMMYIDRKSLAALKHDAAAFVEEAVPR